VDELRRIANRLTGGDRSIAAPPVRDEGTLSAGRPAVAGVSEPAFVQPPVARDRSPFVWLIIAAAILLWLARDVLGPFIVAAVAAYAFSPLVTAAQRRTAWPRAAVVAIGYVIVVAVVAVLAFFLAGRITREIALLAASGPDSLATLLRELVGRDSIDLAGQQISVSDIALEIQSRVGGLVSSPGDAAHLAGEIGSAGLELILALIVTFYFLVDGEMLRDRSIALLPERHRARTVDVLGRIHEVLGKWLRGQVALIFLVATVVYVALGPILHLPYALGIAIVTGVLEIIPLIGPLIATAIAGVDAFARGGGELAAVVVIFYFVIRQIEDQVVMPIVIGRAVHLHPVVTIFAVLVGLSVYGVLGGLLGVPIAAAINVIFRELYPSPPSPPAAASDSVDPSTIPAGSRV
jgi:predicted PurR-regulated permease PerM